jgi:hypothetical protein
MTRRQAKGISIGFVGAAALLGAVAPAPAQDDGAGGGAAAYAGAAAQAATTAAARAEHYRARAAGYRRLGGVGWKGAGLVRWAEGEAARFEALAAAGGAGVPPLLSPEAELWQRRAELYRQQGGVAYKAGLVRWAEERARRAARADDFEPSYSVAAPEDAGTELRPFGPGKPIEPALGYGR